MIKKHGSFHTNIRLKCAFYILDVISCKWFILRIQNIIDIVDIVDIIDIIDIIDWDDIVSQNVPRKV